MLDKERYTTDGEKIECGKFYFLVIPGDPAPDEVTCIKHGPLWSYATNELDNFDVRNDSLFASRENAMARAQQLYEYMVDSYKDRIHNLKDFIAFPLNINLIDNPEARVAYLSKGAELTGFYFTET